MPRECVLALDDAGPVRKARANQLVTGLQLMPLKVTDFGAVGPAPV
jgi:hypothetical protein